MITQDQVPTPTIFAAHDNTLAAVPGVPQIPVFPVDTRVPLFQAMMDLMQPATRAAFVEHHYHGADPAAAFQYRFAADLLDLCCSAINDNQPRDVSLYLTLAYTFLTAARQDEQDTQPLPPKQHNAVEEARNAAEEAQERVSAMYEPYLTTILRAWRFAGPPEAYVNPETHQVEPAACTFTYATAEPQP